MVGICMILCVCVCVLNGFGVRSFLFSQLHARKLSLLKSFLAVYKIMGLLFPDEMVISRSYGHVTVAVSYTNVLVVEQQNEQKVVRAVF